MKNDVTLVHAYNWCKNKFHLQGQVQRIKRCGLYLCKFIKIFPNSERWRNFRNRFIFCITKNLVFVEFKTHYDIRKLIKFRMLHELIDQSNRKMIRHQSLMIRPSKVLQTHAASHKTRENFEDPKVGKSEEIHYLTNPVKKQMKV